MGQPRLSTLGCKKKAIGCTIKRVHSRWSLRKSRLLQVAFWYQLRLDDFFGLTWLSRVLTAWIEYLRQRKRSQLISIFSKNLFTYCGTSKCIFIHDAGSCDQSAICKTSLVSRTRLELIFILDRPYLNFDTVYNVQTLRSRIFVGLCICAFVHELFNTLK